MKLAKRIKQVRRLRGESQEKFARLLDVHQTTVMHWERGNAPRNPLVVETIERRLDEIEAELAQ